MARLTDQLTEGDLDLLTRAARRRGEEADAEHLRADPDLVDELVRSPQAAELVFADDTDVGELAADALLRASPLLVFAVALGRATEQLSELDYVEEWVGPRQRLPVFGVAELRDLLDDAARRELLAVLLASYTRVASGAIRVRTARGVRRRRWSELDPVGLARLAAAAPEQTRPGVQRRLGDLALLLTGVFPDHTARRRFDDRDLRLLAASLAGAETGERDVQALTEAMEVGGTVGLLEHLGQRWYTRALRGLPQRRPALEQLADRFEDARRALNFVTDRFLYRRRGQLFPGAS